MDKEGPFPPLRKYGNNLIQNGGGAYDRSYGGRLNAYVQRNRHTPIYGDNAPSGPSNPGYHSSPRCGRKSQMQSTQDGHFASKGNELRSTRIDAVSSVTNGWGQRGSAFKSPSECVHSNVNGSDHGFGNQAADDVGLKPRRNSFSRRPFVYSDSSNKSRSSDSSAVSADSPNLLYPHCSNSHSSSSSKSSASFSRISENGFSPTASVRGLNRNSPRNPLVKDQFKAFSSIVSNSQTPSPSSTSSRHLSGSSHSPSPCPTSEQSRREDSPSCERLHHSNQHLRSLIMSYSHQRQHGLPSNPSHQNGVTKNFSQASNSSSASNNNSSYLRHDMKANSCSPHQTPTNSLNYSRRQMAMKHPRLSSESEHDRSLGGTLEEPRGYILAKSSSNKNVRHLSPPPASGSQGVRCRLKSSGDVPESPTGFSRRMPLNCSQDHPRPVSNYARSYTNLGCSFSGRNTSQTTDMHGYSSKENYAHPIDAKSRDPPKAVSANNEPGKATPVWRAAGRLTTTCSPNKSFDGKKPSVGQYSRINPVKRNHSFCNDYSTPSYRTRRLTNLANQASGSHQNIYDNNQHSHVTSKGSSPASTPSNGFNLFGNIFNKNTDSNKRVSRRRVKSPPRTLGLNVESPVGHEQNPSPISNYALPISPKPNQARQQQTSRALPSQSCTINLQDAYPLISPMAPSRPQGSVTDSIKSQTSTLLSCMSISSPTGATVTPPNVAFDLEALLKIDDLRSWIQELELSRARGYQTLYSDYDDCELETTKNGDITQKGYEKKRTRLLQPYLPKDQGQAGSSSPSPAASHQQRHAPHPRRRGGGDQAGGGAGGGGGGRPRRTQHRAVTTHEQRYLSGSSTSSSGGPVSGGGGGVSGGSSTSTTTCTNGSGGNGGGQASSPSTGGQSVAGGLSSSAAKRRKQHRRVTRNESRYHSEVRQEAVKEALAQYQSRPKNLPLPSKRASVTTARSPEHHHHDSDSEDSDDDSITAEGSLGSGHSSGHTATPDHPPPPRLPLHPPSTTPPHTNHQHHHSRQLPSLPSNSSSDSGSGPQPPVALPRNSNNINNPVLLPPPTMLQRAPVQTALHQQLVAAGGGTGGSSASPPPPLLQAGGSGGRRSHQQGYLHGSSPQQGGVSSIQQQPLPPVPPHSVGLVNGEEEDRRRREMTEVTDLMRNITTYCDPPDVTQGSQHQRGTAASSRDDRLAGHYARHPHPGQGPHHPLHDQENWRGTGRWKVSNKIQQLLNTLKRPKKRPLPEFYVDDEEDLEIAANPKDPNAPKPEGMVMTPSKGETLVIPAGLPRSVEAAVERYGGSSGFKAPVATVLDANNKLSTPLTYGKLLSRSQKMAYNLLSRLGGRGEGAVLPGDRVALVYPNSDPVAFMCALYACLQAGLVPVPIEVPLSRRDAGSQQIGFLLGSCGVSVALTSEACFKGLPKTTAGEVVVFKGWPKLHWFITDNMQKPPKEWQIPPKAPDDAPAYIEYSTDCDGSVKGVVVNRSALLNHCRSLTSACSYTEGEVAVCVLDFKRDVGLWHSMFCSVFNGMHVVFIPYSVMKVNPASWMHMITKFKASIAIVKSRDLHWGLLATKDHKDISLHSLRLLLVADGANPWSLSSCDQFLSVFQSKGLRPDAICPCAASPQALTVSVRRPGHGGSTAVGRGVLSMQGLSYGVVRVDQDNSLTSLTLQDCGQVMPGAQMLVVRVEGPAYTCRTDEVGEICVSGDGVGNQYWGLPGKTNHTFRVQPLPPPDDPGVIGPTGGSLPPPPPPPNNSTDGGPHYVRTGLLGFLGPGGLVFVCGSRDGLMTVTGRKHNTDDIIATVLAVEPMKFIFRGRIAVFSHRVLRDERICVIAEQRPECSEEESFQWMSRVLQAVDSIHQVGIYCLALVPPNHLPKTPLGGIHLSETKKRFLEGCLHPANVLMCPHACVSNLPKPREVHHDVGPASVMVGNLVQGNRLAMAQGRDIGLMDDEDASRRHPQFIADILKWRANTTENHEILTLLNSKGQVAVSLTCSQLHKKAERVGAHLVDKGHINTGDHVALIYPPGVDLIAAFYGCLYVGAVPVTIRPPHPQNLQSTVNTVRTVVEVSKSVIILSTMSVIKLLKSKEEKFESGKKWPNIVDTDDLPKKRLTSIYRAPTAEMIAYLDFSVSTTGMLAGIKLSHASATALCLSMKVACELYPSRVIALCLDPYCGLGLALWVLSSVYSGHQSILIPPGEVEVNPALWLTAVSQYKVRDTFCSYGVMELCTKGLSSSIGALKQRGVNLSCVRTCIVVAEERPRIALTNSFSKLFNGLGLSPRAVSTSFGCRVNVAVCLQGASSPDPSTVYVDLRSLRHDRVTLVERGAPHSLCLMESGKLLPGAKVVIANPETKGHCSDSHLGEIWVQSNHNSSGYFTVYGDDGSSNDHFNSQLVTGNTGEVYARTGCLGFLKRTESVQADGELHDAVFVVGSLDETVMQRGMRYHPIDIENTVMRCHKKISECAVFSWTNLLVVVVELDGQEYEALDLVPLITSSVVEEHQVIVGVIVVVDPGVVPINSRGEKQRMHLRDGFLADQLDPIYVAYNM